MQAVAMALTGMVREGAQLERGRGVRGTWLQRSAKGLKKFKSEIEVFPLQRWLTMQVRCSRVLYLVLLIVH